MVRESLTEYITRLLKAGYAPGVIRNTLINAGYSPQEINMAMEYTQSTATSRQKTVSITGKTLIIAISALILLILLVIGGIILLSPKPKIIELSVFPSKTQLHQGEKLSFLSKLSSAEEREASVVLTCVLTDKRNNQAIASKQEQLSIAMEKSITTEIMIPESAVPGEYSLKATISYEDKTEQKSFDINIIKKAEAGMVPQQGPEPEAAAIAECPATCDDYNKCTNDFCEKGICRHAPITPCCGNGVCESGENVLNCVDDCRERADTPEELTAKARVIVQTDPESAAAVCSSITRAPQADECFSQVALSSGKNLLCENVQDPESRDRCYVSFALEGDFSVCTRIKNSYMSKACYSLQKTEQIKANINQIKMPSSQSA